MRTKLFFRFLYFSIGFLSVVHFSGSGQSISDFKAKAPRNPGETSITTNISFNGYTNHWHDYYTEWHRYGNLFKIAMPELQSTILQSKVDVAEDLGLPGLLMQEGFITQLFADNYVILENPSVADIEQQIGIGNTLVITDPSSPAGKILEEKADAIFEWTGNLQSHQWNAADFMVIKAFHLVYGDTFLFVISSESKEQINKLKELLNNTRSILEKYNLHKGWFGISTTLKMVTCTPGHPLEIIGKGMNEGNSWFIFSGYIARYGKEELNNWIREVDLPVVANVGYSPIFGCENYDDLQVQSYDGFGREYWINYAHNRGGYAFRPVFDPGGEGFNYDGYIVNEGNKEQIDNENVPFINMAGRLNDNLTSSMVLFIEKETPLSDESIWDAILNRKSVAVLEQATMMGPSFYRNALQLLYLDKDFLEDYYGDKINIKAEVEGYNLIVTIENYYPGPVTGELNVTVPPAIEMAEGLPGSFTLPENGKRQFSIRLQPGKDAMEKTNSVAVEFLWENRKKATVAMLDMPPAISINRLLYTHAPEVNFPVTVHNFSTENVFPVEVIVFEKDKPHNIVFEQTQMCQTETASFKRIDFNLHLDPGNYTVKVNALGTTSESQLGVGISEGNAFVYEVDLNNDGITEYRMENDSVSITLLRTGARVIEYIVKSRNDNIFSKAWPEKPDDYNRPHRLRRFYPYGGFEDFLGQASMETHRVYNAKIIKEDGDYVQVEMETDYYGNHLKKIFTLYGNSPLLEVRFELTFQNPEANMLGPQPILELGESHGPEDLYIVPLLSGLEEIRMMPDRMFGAAFDLKEGWNAGYDTIEDISFVGAFPVSQPVFLHMWMNTDSNQDSRHYYAEFQPWTRIIQKSTMYFSYYLWGSGGGWQESLDELRKRNLVTVR